MYVCTECGNESLKWTGQCSFCKSWNTLVEFKESKTVNKSVNKAEVKELFSLNSQESVNLDKKIISKSNELNTVLGGGIVKGSVILLSGEPGIGKSTLTLQLASLVDEKIIYVSAEETINQINSRAKRLEINTNNISLLAESNIENILASLNKNKTDIVIIDSISVMHSGEISATAGSISQVKYISELLVNFAKSTNTAIFIIGHINKDGALAGPKTLEHMVDTVLFFEGEKYDNLRLLRSLKNRFGATSELAIFSMDETGLHDLENPGLEFVNAKSDTIGSSLSITIEGTRPIIIETESLTTYTKFGYPKRSSRGINNSKLDLIIAVLGKYAGLNLESHDVYANIARGLKIEDPAIDLSITASIISSKTNKSISKDSVFIGEISLTGNIKKVILAEKRIKEAEKMGFKKAYIPFGSKITSKNIDIIEIGNISDLVKALSNIGKTTS